MSCIAGYARAGRSNNKHSAGCPESQSEKQKKPQEKTALPIVTLNARFIFPAEHLLLRSSVSITPYRNRNWRLFFPWSRCIACIGMEKIVFRSPEMNAFYLMIPEGALLVDGMTAEFARMKHFLISEAQGKLAQTGRNALDGALTPEDF